jgi:hypothetical protein
VQEALDAARQADAHWLTAHLTGHLGLLAQDRDDLKQATRHYERSRTLAETFGARRGAALPTPFTRTPRAASRPQPGAAANIFLRSFLVALDGRSEGLALAQPIGNQGRILIGLLHRGRALAAPHRIVEARALLLKGLAQAESSPGHPRHRASPPAAAR